MNKVAIVGSFECLPGKDTETEAVLRAMVAAAREEPGVEIYSYHRGDDRTYWFFALMSDAQSMESHGESPAMQKAMEAFGPLVTEGPRMNMLRPVAGLGLDL